MTATLMIETHITNTDVAKDVFALARKNGTWNGMTEQELRDFQMWNFTRFQNYLMNAKIVKDENWLDNNLRMQMKRAMVHLARMVNPKLYKSNNMYQLLGVDFILDKNLKLWFIEANIKPALIGTNDEKEEFFIKMLQDHYEIMYGYLRSRMKRVVSFLNQLSAVVPKNKILVGEETLPGFETIKKQFDKINKNYLEPEFEPSAGNRFVKVIDENLPGKEAYFGLVDEEECI